ncbi:MAG: hypothetical protein O9306_16470, partial [Beijerinckiaceae bacterium]|nr:hypothetical protein [Beijerinckiaceae bacterium]
MNDDLPPAADWCITRIAARKADSSGRRNGLFLRLQEQCVKRFSGCLPIERFPRPRVERCRDGGNLV